MEFLWPTMLFLLLLLPLFVALYIDLFTRRQKAVARYGSQGLLQQAAVRTPGFRRHIPPLFFLLALTTLIVALARPQTVISLPRVEGTVILAFDVSGSMAADDLKPTRMDAAKAAAQAFVQRQPRTVQIGVVAFSDNGLSVQTPTDDRDTILAAIQRLKPQRGTSLASGILASLKAIAVGSAGPPTHYYSNLTPAPTLTPTAVPAGTYTPGMIVLLTDGENNENPDPLAAAKAAADRGVRIYTVGIGSPTGANLHIGGFIIHTQLDEATLKQISQLTGGSYYAASNAQDLLKIYDTINTQVVVKPQDTEVTSLFAGAGILTLLFGAALSFLWFSRLP